MNTDKKILIIDDERTLHAMMKPIMGSHGLEVLSAFTGEEGLAMARANAPDLIVLDVIMPTMKGREVCKRLKADPATANIPVLFLTAKDSEDDIQAGLAVGAVGHLTKPINPSNLVRLVKKTLGI